MTDAHATAQLHRLIGDAIAAGRREVRLPPGIHRIDGSLLPERYGAVSNNDHGLKRVLFDVDGAEDFVLDGGGATLLCFGEVLPIRIGRSRNVTVRNLAIDWHRPFFSQAVVTESGAGWLQFEFDPERYPLRVDGGRLIARDGRGWQTDVLWNLLPFHAERREVSTRIENWHLSRWHRARPWDANSIRLEANFIETYAPGTPIVLMHGNRVAPGVWIEQSAGVTLQDVTIHHAPGMGVIAQLSRDVTLERLKVAPSGDRLFSTWVDAAHLVDCAGATRLLACELSGQFDDAVNIHSRFSLVVERVSAREALIRSVHPQQAGSNAAVPGAPLAFYRRDDMVRLRVTRVTAARTVNREFLCITVEDDLPPCGGDLICARYEPESAVEVRGCRFGANRGRGVLVNVEHHCVIEQNHFHVSGRAIESAPDANYWWEGSPVQDLAIRNNVFEDCGFGPCGDDLVHLGPELPDGSDPRAGAIRTAAAGGPPPALAPVLRRVRFEGNTIIRHRGRLLHAHAVDGLIVADNRVQSSTRYPVVAVDRQVDLGPGVANATIRMDRPA